MMNNTNNSNDYAKGMLWGALIGGAVGAITALLFAPKSGTELRRDIAETSTNLYGKTSDYLTNVEQQVGGALSRTWSEAKTRGASIIDAARRAGENIAGGAENLVEEAKNKVTGKVGNVRDAAKASADAFKSEMNSPEYKKPDNIL
ncbi:MAG: YtxH domain-containing protein [Chloroflexota bacterium]